MVQLHAKLRWDFGSVQYFYSNLLRLSVQLEQLECGPRVCGHGCEGKGQGGADLQQAGQVLLPGDPAPGHLQPLSHQVPQDHPEEPVRQQRQHRPPVRPQQTEGEQELQAQVPGDVLRPQQLRRLPGGGLRGRLPAVGDGGDQPNLPALAGSQVLRPEDFRPSVQQLQGKH